MAKAIQTYNLRIEEHPEYGDNGIKWDAEGRDYFEPAIGGTQLAHDILEHPVNPHSNGLIDEFMALGALVYIRMETGYRSNRGAYSRGIEDSDVYSDIANLLQYDDYGIPSPGRKVPHGFDLKDYFLELVDQGIKEFYGEIAYGGDKIERLPSHYKNSIANYMAIGYRLAQKRFPCKWDAKRLFTAIEDAANTFLSDYKEMEGTEAVLTVNYKTGQVWIKEDFGDYDSDEE